jgi:hypothetical protein
MFITKDKKVKQSLFNQKLFTKDIINAKQHQSSDLPDQRSVRMKGWSTNSWKKV